MVGLLRKVLGDANEKALKRLHPLADSVNEHSDAVAPLSEQQLRERSDELRSRVEGGESLDDVLPEAFSWPQQEYAGGDYSLTMMAGRQPLITEAIG